MNSSLSLRRFATLSLLGLSLSACGGGGSDEPGPVNQPPVVTIKPGSTETFELLATAVGVEATDPDGDQLTYKWTQTAGTPQTFINEVDGDGFTFGAPKVVGSETLSFTVEVSDGNGNTVTEDIDLLVKEAETVVILAGIRQHNALEVFRRHFTDSNPVHLDVPLGTIPPGDIAHTEGLQLSPDRQRAAWLEDHDNDGRLELKVVEIKGNATRSLAPDLDTSDEHVVDFRWSPDGQSIAYLKASDTFGHQLFVVDAASADGSDARLVSGETTYSDGIPGNGALDGFIRNFAWSPGGDRIAFIGSVRVAQGLLYISNASSGQRTEMDLTEIVSLQGSVGSFDWSPNGARIVMTERLDDLDNESISLLDTADGTWQKLVDINDGVDFFFDRQALSFSPNGQLVAFLARAVGDFATGLYVVTPDKTVFNRVSGDAANPAAVGGGVGNFKWAPDSTHLAFVGDMETEANKELFVVAATSPDGSNRRKISGTMPDWTVDGVPDGDISEFNFDWSPDSKHIAFGGRSVVRDGFYDVFISSAEGDGSDRRTVSGAAIDFDNDGVLDSNFYEILWSPSGNHLYFTGDISKDNDHELLKVAADTTDGGDRVSVSGPMAAGGDVDEYVVGGPTD